MTRPHATLPGPLFAAMLALLASGLACTLLTPTPPATSVTLTDTPTPIITTPAPIAPAATAPAAATPVPAMPAATEASASGPWVVYALAGGSQVVARDPATDAAIPVSLESPLLWPADLTAGASPDGKWLAIRTGKRDLSDLSLELIAFPTGAIQKRVPLLSGDARKQPPPANGGLPTVAAAVSQPDALRWSADGRWLAFVGAMDGPSSDLYLFDSQTGDTRRLTGGLNQVASPNWSPDGLWLAFEEVLNFSASPGWKLGAVWEAATDHNEMRKLYVPPTNSTGEGFLAWSTPDTLIVYTHAPDAIHDIRSVPVSARFVDRLYDGPVDQLTFDPTAQTLAFSETDISGAPVGLAPGLYVLPGMKGAPQFVRAGSWGRLAFSAPLGRFLASGDQGLLLFDGGGNVTLLEGEAAGLASPDGHWLVAWGDRTHPGVRLYRPDGTLMQAITPAAAAPLLWQPDSKAFFYIAGTSLYRVRFPNAQPEELVQGILPAGLGWLGKE